MNKIYYNELSNIPQVSNEQLLTLINEAKAGDIQAKTKVVMLHLKLVVHYANQFKKYLPEYSSITVDDLINEGNIGLLESIDKYDPEQETKLSYFAGVQIKRKIIDCLIYHQSTIRMPYHKQKQLLEKSKMLDKMMKSGGEIEETIDKPTKILLPDFYEFEDKTDDDENASEMMEKLEIGLKYLKSRERKIISEYFGIDTEKKTLSKIGEELNITKARVWDIKRQAIMKLKEGSI